MKGLIPIFMLFCAFNLQAQNLIYNGSFEEVEGCITIINGQLAHWYNPIEGSPDIYFSNIGCTNELALLPQDGNHYVGVYTGYPDLNSEDAKEYLTTRLASSLESGKTYELRFWIRESQYSGFRSDQIGVYFSQDSISGNDVNLNNITPQFQTPPNVIFNDDEWTAIVTTYIADGGEEFLTFGCFVPHEELTFIYEYHPNQTFTGGGYYEFDNFSLVEIEDVNVEEQTSVVQLYPNPTSDVLHLKSSSSIAKLMVWSAEGALLIEEQNPSPVLDLSNFSSGMYFVHVQHVQGQWQREKILVR